MSNEIELWERIGRCKVPGLEMAVSQPRFCDLYRGDDIAHLKPESTPAHHRAAAMLVVDALEAAETCVFTRLGERDVWMASGDWYHDKHDDIEQSWRDDNNGGKEHLALLALLAEVAEALPKATFHDRVKGAKRPGPEYYE